MADSSTTKKTSKTSKGKGLSKHYGPLPLWGWIVVLGVGYYVYSKGSTSSTAATTATTATAAPAGSGDGGGGYGGGGYFPSQAGGTTGGGSSGGGGGGNGNSAAITSALAALTSALSGLGTQATAQPQAQVPTTVVNVTPSPGLQTAQPTVTAGQPAPAAAATSSAASSTQGSLSGANNPLSSKSAGGTGSANPLTPKVADTPNLFGGSAGSSSSTGAHSYTFGSVNYTSSASPIRQGGSVYYPVPNQTVANSLKKAGYSTFVQGSSIGGNAGATYLKR